LFYRIVGRVKAAKHRLLFDDPNLIPVDPRTLSHTQQQVLAKKLRRMQPLMAGYIPMAESYEAAAKLLPNDDERYAGELFMLNQLTALYS